MSAQVVVDTDQTAKALLERGQLTKRVTIIPLNQVRQVSEFRPNFLQGCEEVTWVVAVGMGRG